MGHLIFIILHLLAVLFLGPMLLFLTLPLHLIYAAVAGGKRDPREGSFSKYVSCPWCQEAVHQEASVCPRCRKGLVPLSEQRAAHRAANPGIWGWLSQPR